MNQSDIIHIQNILKGNKESEQIIYDRYRKIVKDIINRKFSSVNINTDSVDDYVSEIMITLFTSLHKFDDSKSSFKTWAYTITKNYMLNTFKHNDFNIFSHEDICECTNSINASIEYEVDSSLRFISKQISETDYTMLSMKYLDGYNYNEIGKEFNTTSTCICNKISYIKTKLKANKHLIYD